MTGSKGHTGAGEATLPRAVHDAPGQKTQHIPRPTHTLPTRLNIPQHTYTTTPDIPRHVSAVRSYKPKFLDIRPSNDHKAGCGCARVMHTRPAHTRIPVSCTNTYGYPHGSTSRTTKHTTHQPRSVGQLLTHSQRMIHTNLARPRVIRSRQEGVRFPSVGRLTTKMQTHTTPPHTKPTQSTHSFTPFKRRRLSTYGTVVRRGRTEKSYVGASNLIHPHPKKVIRAPTTPITIQEEGHLIPRTTDASNTHSHILTTTSSRPPRSTPSPNLT